MLTHADWDQVKMDQEPEISYSNSQIFLSQLYI